MPGQRPRQLARYVLIEQNLQKLRLKSMLGAIVENGSDNVEASFRVAIRRFGNSRVRR
jgi:nucleoid DNA-binding protein